MIDKVLFSRQSDHWATPAKLYAELDAEFSFNFDPCPLNADFDSLEGDWPKDCRAFINPPYSNIRAFIEKAVEQIEFYQCKLAVFLIPARTDTRWFHDLVYNKAEIRFIKGRLKFGDSRNSAPFPSMICIFRG